MKMKKLELEIAMLSCEKEGTGMPILILQ